MPATARAFMCLGSILAASMFGLSLIMLHYRRKAKQLGEDVKPLEFKPWK